MGFIRTDYSLVPPERSVAQEESSSSVKPVKTSLSSEIATTSFVPYEPLRLPHNPASRFQTVDMVIPSEGLVLELSSFNGQSTRPPLVVESNAGSVSELSSLVKSSLLVPVSN